MKFKISFFFFFCICVCAGQDSVYVDKRDGKVYPLVTLENVQWFKTNLSFASATSWCTQQTKIINCADGNFYSYKGLDSVCPQGWRIPNWTEWESAIKVVVKLNKLDRTKIKLDSSKYNRASILVNGINLFKDSLGLNIKPVGWVEGNKREGQRNNQANFWVLEPATGDPTTHIHIADKGYVKHGHDHEIIDKPKNQRRFSVRCVRTKE